MSEQRAVIIKDNGRFVMRVDPRTRKATTEPQQFYMHPDERGYSLQILERSQWVSDPDVIDVQSMTGLSNR